VAVRVPARVVVGSALYTVLLSPLVLGVLQRMQRVFEFDTGRRRLR
jgi:hypothetical protein